MPNAITNDFGQKLTKADVINTSRGYITVPVFSKVIDYETIPPTCVCAINFNVGRRITFKLPVSAPRDVMLGFGDNHNFALVVAWRAYNSQIVNRYILWNNGSSDNLHYPAYTGELIGSRFRLEIWDTVKDLSNEVHARSALDYFTSLFKLKTSVDEADSYSVATGTYVANLQSVDSGVNDQIDLPCIYSDAQVVPSELIVY